MQQAERGMMMARRKGGHGEAVSVARVLFWITM